jgi:hypothetical protein
MLQKFFQSAIAEAKNGSPMSFETSEYVEKLIAAGYHKATENGKGMSAAAYRKLWPTTVIQPPEYADRFDAVLLVDCTIAISELVRCGDFYVVVTPESCTDLVPAPVHPETGNALTRYVAFCQLGEQNLNRTVEDCRKTMAEDEVGLVSVDGLHLPIQYAEYSKEYAVDLAGSRYDAIGAPYVSWFGSARPIFSRSGVRHPNPGCGSGSRGRKVISVT